MMIVIRLGRLVGRNLVSLNFKVVWGSKNLEKFNLACLTKQCRRLAVQSTRLWAQVLKGLYFPHSSFWVAQSRRYCSWIMKIGIRMNIGDGQKTLPRSESWMPGVVSFKLSRPASCPLHINRVLDLIDHTTLQWKRSLIYRIVPIAHAQAIFVIPIAPFGTFDTLVWHYEWHSQYTIHSRYKLLVQSSIQDTLNATASHSNIVSYSFWKDHGLYPFLRNLGTLFGAFYIMQYLF